VAAIDGVLASLVAQVAQAESLLDGGAARTDTARRLLHQARLDVERARGALKLLQARAAIADAPAHGAADAAVGLGATSMPAPAEVFWVAVVDDDPGARKLVSHWLTRSKFECVEYRTGSEAVEALEASPDPIDAVVLDVMMPGMNGFDVLARLKSNPSTAAIPVIMVTAHARGEADIANGVAAGAADLIAKPFSGPVLVAKVRAACEKRGAERNLRARLRSAEEHASTDVLTELLNRRAFEKLLLERSAQSALLSEPLALVLIDLDHFKDVNDTFGHDGGDRVLVHFARALRKTVRAGDQAFRYGGEEFALLLPQCSSEDTLRILARIQGELRDQPVSVGGADRILVRFSAGIATSDAHNGHRIDDLVGRADAALYRAKTGGRDRFEVESDTH
jgi:diguanylate cyclase (GGDEF)-like protein